MSPIGKPQARPVTRIRWLLLPLVLLGATGVWFALQPAFERAGSTPALAAEMSQEEFERRVREYLLEHPEVIMEAVNRLEARQRASEQTEAEATLKRHAEEVFRDPDTPVAANPNGDVTLVEFFDYNCPYCRQMAPVMLEAEKSDPQLRIVYKEFPILGPNSVHAAKAALAAHKQGKYLAFHKALFEGRGTVDPGRVTEAAKKVGLDLERLKVDLADPAIQKAIEKNLALAQELRIDGTPGFVAGKKILRGATNLKTLQAFIAEARAANSAGESGTGR